MGQHLRFTGVITMIEVLQYQFMQNALLGGIMIATLCSMMGTFLVPQRFSLLGDGLAHLAFGGIALGLLLGVNPLITAGIVCILGALYLSYNKSQEKVYGESAIAVLLTVGMAIAILLISIAGGFNVDLFGYLFGSILTITPIELYIVLLVLIFISMFLWHNYSDLCLYTFHQGLAQVSGVKTAWLGSTFLVLTAITTVLSIRIVGILLITALIVLPVITAMQISRSMRETFIYSIIIANISVVIGILLSFYLDLAPSAMIVLVLAFCYGICSVVGRRFE
jgi:zinc transport system permease protein